MFSPQELAAAKQQYDAYSSSRPQTTAVKPKPKAKQKGRGGFLTSLISEVGGLGGASGGAAIGTALLPGVGTLIGAGLGGFLGGTGGRITENKVRDNRIGVGDALKEGAISGVASAGPLKLLKAASGATKGAIRTSRPVEDTITKKVASRGIPVKFSSETSTAKSVPVTKKHIMVNPSVGDVADAETALSKQGFATKGKVTRSEGVNVPAKNKRNAFTGAIPGEYGITPGTPIVSMKGKKTTLPFNETDSTENGIINTPDHFIDEVIPGTQPSKIKGALDGANNALNNSFLNRLTNKTGKKLTEAGSGLKADPNVGGVARLEDNANFMSKYVGTPRKQRVAMERDMGTLGKEVDNILDRTPTQLDGSLVGQRLKTASQDLTDERFLDLDLNNPSVTKIIDRYSEKFAQADGAKGINDLTKTLNKTATRAQRKLLDEKGSPLTAQEQAALALKRSADDVLSEIPEIAPLKKEMAQIFEVTPQVAKQAERGLTSPMMLGGVKFKAPVQLANSVQSRAGSKLQSSSDDVPGLANFASRILGGAALTRPLPEEEQIAPEEPTIPQPNNADSLDSLTSPEETPRSNDPFAPENAQASVQKILAQGGDMKDVAAYLSNVQALQELTAPTKSKGLNSTASGVIADTKTGLASLQELANQIESSSANNPVVGRIRGLNPFDTNAQSLQASIATTKQIVGKALEGGVLRKEDEVKYAKLLPTMGDTDATARHKIAQLTNLISGRLGEYQANMSGGTGGADLATIGL